MSAYKVSDIGRASMTHAQEVVADLMRATLAPDVQPESYAQRVKRILAETARRYPGCISVRVRKRRPS